MTASLVQVFVIAALLNSSMSSLRTYYIIRDSNIVMDQDITSGILKLDDSTKYGKDSDFYTTIMAPVGYQVLITFNYSDFHEFLGCKDYVKIIDGYLLLYRKWRALSASLCDDDMLNKPYTSSGRFITVHFHSDHIEESSRFTLAYTAIHTGPCSEGELQCKNGFCINKSLSCNGYSNCGDGSDESICFSTQDDITPFVVPRRKELIIFINVFGGIAGIILLCCFGICVRFCVKKIKERRNTRHSRTPRITPEDTLMMEVDSTPRLPPTAPPSQSPMTSRQQHYQTQGYIAELNQDPPTYEEAMNNSRPLSKLGETYSPFINDPHI